MDILLVSSREADLAYMEATNEIAMAMNCSDISDFMEDADSAKKSNGGIINAIRNLVEKIKAFFTNLFSGSDEMRAKANAVLKNKELAAKKVEVLDNAKIKKNYGEFKRRIENAKTVEEVDKIAAEYNNKKNGKKILAACAVTVGLGALAAKVLAPKYKEANAKDLDELYKDYEQSNDAYLAEEKKYDDKYKGLGAKSKKVQDLHKEAESKLQHYESIKNGTAPKSELAKRKMHILGTVVADEMNALKESASQKVNAIRTNISGKVQAHKDVKAGKKAGKEVEKEVKETGIITKKNGQVDVEATQKAAPDYGESAEDPELAFFGETDLYEESGSIKEKVSEIIEKIIKAIKDAYQAIKDKVDRAKLKKILNSELAKSEKMIKFKVNDKAIVKAVDAELKIRNKAVVAVKKVEQDFVRGKISYEDATAKVEDIYTATNADVADIYTKHMAGYVKLQANEYRMSQIRTYTLKLMDYQDNILARCQKNIEAEEARILKEVKELEKASPYNEAADPVDATKNTSAMLRFKRKLATVFGRIDKSTANKIASTIAIASCIAVFHNYDKHYRATHSNDSNKGSMFDPNGLPGPGNKPVIDAEFRPA
mgnify:FL=1